jgi:uncharacterized membrane protein YbhN (UPF0104 family)
VTERPTRLSRLLRAVTSLPGRIFITLFLLGLVARSIDWGELGEALESARWEFAALGVGLGVVSLVLGGLRWTLYLKRLELGASTFEGVRAYFVGNFSNLALPTGFGGDAVRALLIARSGARLARAITSVLFDRLSALACLVLLAWIGAAASGDFVPGNQVSLLAALSAAGAVAAVVLVALLRRDGLGRFLPAGLRPWAREVAVALRLIVFSLRLQLSTLALGLLAQAAIVGVVWALAEALSLDLPFGYLIVVSALVVVATLLPVSVGGFGIREGTYVVLLGAVGVTSQDAVLLSVLTVPTMTLASLPGGIAMLLGRVSVSPPPADELEVVREPGEHGPGLTENRVP